MTSFLELCRERRSYRKYQAKEVEKDKLERILQCALMAPSGKRMNPWEFYVEQNRATIQSLADCREMGTVMLRTAPVAIAVALDTSLIDTWQADGAIAAEHLMLAATDEGLGACWCHIYQREQAEARVKEAFGIPQNLTVLCLITIGYKDEERQLYDLQKLNYKKIHAVNQL